MTSRKSGKPGVPLQLQPPPGEGDIATRRKRDKAEELFATQCRWRRLPPFERNYMFAIAAMGRRWRADFAWPQYKLLVEVEGLVVRRLGGQLIVTGRHASITGFREDCVKYASAAVLGLTVLRFEQSQVKDRVALDYTIQALAARGWGGST